MRIHKPIHPQANKLSAGCYLNMM